MVARGYEASGFQRQVSLRHANAIIALIKVHARLDQATTRHLTRRIEAFPCISMRFLTSSAVEVSESIEMRPMKIHGGMA